ncbi:MAG: hypothetical protein WC492_00970 [Candidatus Micrarchaeia archaeon]
MGGLKTISEELTSETITRLANETTKVVQENHPKDAKFSKLDGMEKVSYAYNKYRNEFKTAFDNLSNGNADAWLRFEQQIKNYEERRMSDFANKVQTDKSTSDRQVSEFLKTTVPVKQQTEAEYSKKFSEESKRKYDREKVS